MRPDLFIGFSCVALLAAAGCKGELSFEPASARPSAPHDAPDDLTRPDPKDGPLEASAFTTSPGIRRLTTREYMHAVEDLTGVRPTAQPPTELVVEGHGAIAGAQKVGYADVEGFFELGDAVAELAAPTWLEASACGAGATCLEEWATGFLRRAFREPPDAETTGRYVSILTDPEAGDDLDQRATTFLSVILSSPLFLYRREVGDPARRMGTTTPLTEYELAQRMSFLVWGSGPDDALLDAAARGELSDPARRTAQLERMLEDERARRGTRAFVADWMAVLHESIATKDASVLEGTDAQLPASARASLDATVDAVLGAPGAGFADLLSTDTFVVDARVAGLLDVDPPRGDALEPRAIDTTQRAGILTHPLVVAAHSKESGASPFPIGAFVFGNVLCETIHAPTVIPTLEDVELDESMTLRERLESQTTSPQCAFCHNRIGPPGFAFLTFDPLGRHSEADPAGRPFDTAGSIPVGDDTLEFEHVAELSMKLAEHPETATCIARRLFRYTFGRFEAPGDADTLDTLSALAIEERTAAHTMLRAIVAHPDFALAHHEVTP